MSYCIIYPRIVCVQTVANNPIPVVDLLVHLFVQSKQRCLLIHKVLEHGRANFGYSKEGDDRYGSSFFCTSCGANVCYCMHIDERVIGPVCDESTHRVTKQETVDYHDNE